MPITSMKNLRLSSNFGVRISTWPRWAMSWIGSACIDILLLSASTLPAGTGKGQHQIVRRHIYSLSKNQSASGGKCGKVARIAHAPARVLGLQLGIKGSVAGRYVRAVAHERAVDEEPAVVGEVAAGAGDQVLRHRSTVRCAARCSKASRSAPRRGSRSRQRRQGRCAAVRVHCRGRLAAARRRCSPNATHKYRSATRRAAASARQR